MPPPRCGWLKFTPPLWVRGIPNDGRKLNLSKFLKNENHAGQVGAEKSNETSSGIEIHHGSVVLVLSAALSLTTDT
jgi:hypothetical protein